jgi:hypothetical protein
MGVCVCVFVGVWVGEGWSVSDEEVSEAEKEKVEAMEEVVEEREAVERVLRESWWL